MGMVTLALVRGSIKIKKVRGRVKNRVNEVSTPNTKRASELYFNSIWSIFY